jgi:hypothetical protein
LNEHFYRDVFEEPKPTVKEPTKHESCECQIEEPLDNDTPANFPKPNTMKSPRMAGLEMLLGDAWEPQTKGSHQNRAGQDLLTESTQLAFENEEYEKMIPIYNAPGTSNIHDHKVGIDYSKSCKAATESQLTKKRNEAMEDKLDVIG